ncbi:MAG: hypothetical protein GY759_06600 [Chloroflexi bacterium]|nr:hypothetical protein [Chloroflexota bacterium]
MTIEVEQLYEQHISQLPLSEQLRLVALISQKWIRLSDDMADKAPRSIMELHGLGKEIWQDVDAQDYVDSLRQEWVQRP